MYTHANVHAQAFRQISGRPVSDHPRIEKIDLQNNPLFMRCKTAYDVKQAYENFWNEMNTFVPETVVFVARVEMIQEG